MYFVTNIADAAFGAATDPYSLVIIAAAIGFYFLVHSRLQAGKVRDLVDVGFASAVLILASANGRLQERRDIEKDAQIVLVKADGSYSLSDKASLQLSDVASFNGWGEQEVERHGSRLVMDIGSVKLSAGKPDADRMFDRMKPAIGLSPTSKKLSAMTQAEWASLFKDSNDRLRRYVGEKSWCSFRLTGIDRALPGMFAGDTQPIVVDGKQLGTLRVVNVFNTQDSLPGSAEACTVQFTRK